MLATVNSFDLLRVSASILVMLSHSLALTGMREPIITNGYTIGNVAVFFFFSISGYLVYQSLERDPHILRFLARRALRIGPGLAVVLALSVMVLGPICSTYAPKDYFAQSETWAYLAKIRLYGSDRLPGVFERNPYPLAINSSLWTLKWEWLMYCFLAMLALIPRSRHMLVVLLALGGLIPLVGACISFDLLDGVAFLKAAGVSKAFSDFIVLASFFLAGGLLAIIRQSIQPRVLLALALAVSVAATPTLGTNIGIIGLIVAVPMIVVAVGESNFQQLVGLTIRNDLSYGIYIYAFPIQQIVSMSIPGIPWYLAFAMALAGTVFASYLSWRFVEARSLSLKKALKLRQAYLGRSRSMAQNGLDGSCPSTVAGLARIRSLSADSFRCLAWPWPVTTRKLGDTVASATIIPGKNGRTCYCKPRILQEHLDLDVVPQAFREEVRQEIVRSLAEAFDMAYWEGSYEGAREIYSKLPPNARTLKRRFKAVVSSWRAKA